MMNHEHDPKVDRVKLRVPGERQKRIISHLVQRLADIPGPSMLLCVGEPGSGKTFCTRSTIEAMGAQVVQVDPRQIESPRAGDPVRQVEKAVLQVIGLLRQKQPAALHFDDLDTILGRIGELTQYTVNFQLIHAFLMAILDDPRRVFGKRTPTIPIFATANNVTVLPQSLIRSGRAEVLHWDLSLEEKRVMVGPLFAHLKATEIEQLVNWFPTEPIAFFADLKKMFADAVARAQITHVKPREALRLAMLGRWQAALGLPRLEELTSLGKQVQDSRRKAGCEEECHDAN